jgi:glycosyltransferase involved in cell wall biosynthesis
MESLFMKIAIMSAWNTTSGVCMHSEPIGKAFLNMGHKLTVFSFNKDDYHGGGITADDEDYVIRCFGTRQHTNTLDPRPFIDKEYDILMVEDIGMLPVSKFADIIPIIKKKAKIIHVVHENRPCEHTWFYKIEWDKVVYFDKRQEFLLKAYPDAKYIPFPCYNIRVGDKKKSRRKLGLPLNKRIVYQFVHRGYDMFYRDLPRELKNDTILLHVIKEDEPEMLEEISPGDNIIIKREAVITTEKYDEYLFASDALILHKFQSREHAVVSTTALQALGTGCPIFVPKESDFFSDLYNEILYYENTADLDKKLIEILNNEKKRKDLNKNMEKYVNINSPQNIAKQFENLFKRVLKK